MSAEIRDFDELIINNTLESFINASQALGEPVTSLALKVKKAFLNQRALISYGLSNAEPPQDSPVMTSFYGSIKEIVDFRENPGSPFSNHFATIREAICALGWISVKPAPTPYIRDMRDAGQYYSNRVLSSHKGNNMHSGWVTKWGDLLTTLHDYVKKHFVTGFAWGSGAKAGGMAGPPPPPPPPPAEFFDSQPSGDNSRQALLNDLNQGAAITRSLKPVNRSAPGGGSAQKPLPAVTGKIAGAPKVLTPPKFALEGRKWVVEHQKSNTNLNVANDDMAQSLAMYKCEDSCLQVMNKMNSVTIDSCRKTNVAVKAIISSVEIIRCERVKIQCDEQVPLINLDSCDSVEIYLKPEARGVEIISSKSNSLNVCLLEADGNFQEISIPEQIKTIVSGKKLISTVIEKI